MRQSRAPQEGSPEAPVGSLLFLEAESSNIAPLLPATLAPDRWNRAFAGWCVQAQTPHGGRRGLLQTDKKRTSAVIRSSANAPVRPPYGPDQACPVRRRELGHLSSRCKAAATRRDWAESAQCAGGRLLPLLLLPQHTRQQHCLHFHLAS